jgi:glycosyltransferase involved in cell wall biosynthesis
MVNSFETGGSERQFVALASALDRNAFQIRLGCIRRQGELGAGLSHIAEFRLGGSLHGWRSLSARAKLARHLRQCDIAIAHAFDFYTNLTLIPAARLARVPVVIASQRQLGDLLTPAQARVQDLAFRWSDCVVCNSRTVAERLIDRGIPQRKLAVIENGLPPEAFAVAAPALPRRPGVLRVGMIAVMRFHYKNHAGFLRAAALLSRRIPELEFLLVGDGPLRPELEFIASSLGIGGQVRFLGERRDVPALLASIDVTVLPSVSEGLSNAILESMAAGVPVVAARVGGNPELVVEGTGLLVRPKDDEMLAGALATLLSDNRLREKFGENARRFALEHFTLDRMCRKYQELYSELLDQKRPRPATPAPRGTAFAAGAAPHKVAIVAPSLRYVGGQSVQADLMSRYWRHDPVIEARLVHIDPRLPAALRWIERIAFLRTLVREPIYLAALWRELRECDIVHIFSASYWSFLLAPAPALLLSRVRGKKTLINYHSGEVRDHLRRFRTALPILRRAHQLVVPSPYLAGIFREFGLEARVVPNVVDLDDFSFRLRDPLRPRLLCTRGFHRYYSVDVVVRAFVQIKPSFPEATLCLAGKGPSEVEIRGLVRELGVNGVEFAGALSRREIGAAYDRSDIFINASWLDNMPVSILEAFSCGTPVVTTAPEGIRSLVEHERTGLLSQPGDWYSLAGNVVRLLREPDLARRLALNASEEARRYRWASVREQWLAIYDSLDSGRAGELAAHSAISPVAHSADADPGLENRPAGVGSSRRL